MSIIIKPIYHQKEEPDEPVQEEADEQPEEKVRPTIIVTPKKEEEEKTVGNMTKEEFIELFVESMIVYESSKDHPNPATVKGDANEPSNFVDNVFGTIGHIGHGVVDLAEALLRGTIDLASLGKAKRKPSGS